MAPCRPVIVAGMASSIFFLTGLATLIVAAVTLDRYHQYVADNSWALRSEQPGARLQIVEPYVAVGKTNIGILEGQVAIGVLGFLGGLLAVIRRARVALCRGPLAQSETIIGIACLLTVALAITGVFGWVFSDYQRGGQMVLSTWPDGLLSMVTLSSRTSLKLVSWENYTCALEPYLTATGFYGNWWQRSCRLNMAAKWITVPVLIFAFVAFVAECAAVRADRADRAGSCRDGEPADSTH